VELADAATGCGVLLAFYLLQDANGIADFSEAMAYFSALGIASEQMAVDSWARTLEANVAAGGRTKILSHGQEGGDAGRALIDGHGRGRYPAGSAVL